MKVIHSIPELRKEISELKLQNKKIGLVPTMGSLHQGHLSLVEISKQNSDFTVMTIFVNKIQFNDPNDFSKYPREFENDLEKARSAGVDLLFAPDDESMYQNNLTTIHLEKITDNLCGAFRPGHFSGVFTVVAKLFNLVQPDTAIFGQKDIQQVISIEKMVFDLNFPIKIVVAPICREPDGLAMSSRNKLLSPAERKKALILYKILNKAKELISAGENSCTNLTAELKNFLENEDSEISLEYLSFVDYSTLQNIEKISNKSVLALATYIGSTRLIDNMIIETGDSTRCIY